MSFSLLTRQAPLSILHIVTTWLVLMKHITIHDTKLFARRHVDGVYNLRAIMLLSVTLIILLLYIRA